VPDALPPSHGSELVQAFEEIVGRRHVLTRPADTLPYRSGYRTGGGPVLAVVRPGSLVEMWRVARRAVEGGCVLIMQAANTGLTGGSTPDGSYDRPVVVLSTLRIDRFWLIRNNSQVVCLPGTTLDRLERALKRHGREPHSVIGSSCLGASVVGGICNNSGGALVQRGPAYTEMALFGQVGADGQLRLVNHLGIALGNDPEEILRRLETGAFSERDVAPEAGRGHDDRYAAHVRDTESDEPARYNADPSRLFEASGCAGHLVVFAVRVDTFAAEADPSVFYVGTNDPDVLEELRRRILRDLSALPVAGEYMHRDAFDIADRYGKDIVLAVERLGTARLPKLFALKSRVDRIAKRLPLVPDGAADRLMQWAGRLFADHLPPRLRAYRAQFEHHLMLKVSGPLASETERLLAGVLASGNGAFFRCTAAEGAKAFLHRFACAGAAVRYRAVHPDSVEDIVALDIALRRNERDWFERLPPEIDAACLHKLYYGHFLCHVMHQDYVVRKNTDCHALEERMLEGLDRRGARYPAEHNVGTLYRASPEQQASFAALDPCNCLNPGTGQTSKLRRCDPVAA
jgi:D-lactate dehydrogenase (quinone)